MAGWKVISKTPESRMLDGTEPGMTRILNFEMNEQNISSGDFEE